MNINLTCVVAISNENKFREFHQKWLAELEGHKLIIVENCAGRSFEISDEDVTHLSWVDIDADLGQAYWIIPHNSPALISYGCWKAVQRGAEVIVVLDENAQPGNKPVLKRHLEVLSSHEEESAWTDVLNNIKAKGVPFHNRNRKLPIALNHGMWTENAVLDAATELSLNSDSPEISCHETVIPRGHYFSMSSVNLAFNSECAPLMYFLLMGEGFPFEGFGDIWSGVFAKKIIDHLNLGCRSGDPFVKNFREVDIWTSLRSEANTLPVNESLWEKIDSLVLTSDKPAVCYRQIAELIGGWGHPYFQKLGKAMNLWAGLFLGEDIAKVEESTEVKSPSQLLSYIKEDPVKTIRPKLPSEADGLLDFLHNKAQIQEIEEDTEEVVASKLVSPLLDETIEEEVVNVDIAEETLTTKKGLKDQTQKFRKKEGLKELKGYTQSVSKDKKAYVSQPKNLLLKKPGNEAFIPRKN
jgi:reversibly glycosylated polypeptide / UDP-arabinopyranose mutase